MKKYYNERFKSLKTNIGTVVAEMDSVQQVARENARLKRELQDFKRVQEVYAAKIKEMLVNFQAR